MNGKPEKRVVRGPNGKMQVKKVRESSWTARKRRIFLDHLTATSNVRASAKAAGMNVRSAYALRARDAQFAAEWDAAIAAAQARLEGKLIVYAETRGETGAGTEDDDLAGFDPKLALETLRLYRGRRERGHRPRGGPRPRTASREETEAAVMKVLKKLRKQLGAGA